MRKKSSTLWLVLLVVLTSCRSGGSTTDVGQISIAERGESLEDHVSETSASSGDEFSAPEGIDLAQRVILLVNAARLDQGLSPLAEHALLTGMANSHSQRMAARGFFDHRDPELGGVQDRAKQSGYSFSALGENIAAGVSSPEELVSAWMASPGHRDNILGSSFTQIGVGFVNDPDSEHGSYWTMIVGRP